MAKGVAAISSSSSTTTSINRIIVDAKKTKIKQNEAIKGVGCIK